MAIIYNSDLSKEVIAGAKIQTSRDVIPNQIADKVVPVMEVNPKLLRRINTFGAGTASNATSATVYTTPTDRDFFLTAAVFSMIKDATSTSTLSNLITTIDGASVNLIRIPGFTLTAQSGSISISFPQPIKIDRGVTIRLNNTTNVANITCTATIFGFIDEMSNA